MGQTGNFDGDDIIDIILQQDQTALFICEKIYKWFVYEVQDETFVNEMATIFRNSNYEIMPVMEYMLSSDHFYNKKLSRLHDSKSIDCNPRYISTI